MANEKTNQAEDFKALDTVEKTRDLQTQQIQQRIAADEATVKPDNGMDVSEAEQRWGRKLTAAEVQTRLKKMNMNFIFEPSRHIPSQTGIYVAERMTDPFTGAESVTKKYVGGMMTEMCPEFSIIVKGDVKYPDPHNPGFVRVRTMEAEIRGWRSTVLQLIRGKYITLPQAEKHFHISAGKDSERWQRQVSPAIEVMH